MIFCQILAVIVMFNVLFNKKWHEAYRKRAEKSAQMPLWFTIFIVVTCFSVAFILSFYGKNSNKSKTSISQTDSRVTGKASSILHGWP